MQSLCIRITVCVWRRWRVEEILHIKLLDQEKNKEQKLADIYYFFLTNPFFYDILTIIQEGVAECSAFLTTVISTFCPVV